jgi:outer membrane protein OmpA-like peptidoglycan-associated protein
MSDPPPSQGGNPPPAQTATAGDVPSMSAQHDVYARGPYKVGPTDDPTKFNAIRIPLIPVACWRLNDPAFAFDSSFVSPNFRDELTPLSGIIASNQSCPAALFGHCDPEGSDALNKTLGDRRAIAIYALLTRQPDLWKYLYDTPQVGDTWGTPMVQTMLNSIVDGQGNPYYAGNPDGQYGPDTTDAVKRFQGDSGLAADGQAGADTRKALFGAYMDWLCTPASPAGTPPPTPAPTPFRMQPTDFLGGTGAQPGDLPKMSLQSCGKFNPIVLLATDEMSSSDKGTRHADDAPNRRVIMFLFPKGTSVDSGMWPCPKVKESNAACNAAFWPDGDTRRKNTDTLRLYKDTRDTMACRFYDRFARRSPCEGGQKLKYWVIRLLNPPENGPSTTDGLPVANQPFTASNEGSSTPRASGQTDEDGILRVRVLADPEKFVVKFLDKEIHVDAGSLTKLEESPPNDQVKERLYNLGYGHYDPAQWQTDEYDLALRTFQDQHGVAASEQGTLSSDTVAKLKKYHDGIDG